MLFVRKCKIKNVKQTIQVLSSPS